jgi:hypothetical protein
MATHDEVIKCLEYSQELMNKYWDRIEKSIGNNPINAIHKRNQNDYFRKLINDIKDKKHELIMDDYI